MTPAAQPPAPSSDALIAVASAPSWRIVAGTVAGVIVIGGALFFAGGASVRLTDVESKVKTHGTEIQSLKDSRVWDSWNLYQLCKASAPDKSECRQPAPPPALLAKD